MALGCLVTGEKLIKKIPGQPKTVAGCTESRFSEIVNVYPTEADHIQKIANGLMVTLNL